MQKKILSVKEVAKMLGRSPYTIRVYTKRKNNPLPAHYISNQPSFYEHEVINWYESQPKNY